MRSWGSGTCSGQMCSQDVLSSPEGAMEGGSHMPQRVKVPKYRGIRAQIPYLQYWLLEADTII